MSSYNAGSATPIVLSPVMDRGAVTVHLGEFRSALASGQAIEIHCGGVSQIGQAGLQLLASLAKTCRERAVPLNFEGLSAIWSMIQLAGMADIFATPPASNDGDDQ